jgi:general L-amino acid transport system permease protein
MLRVIIMVTLFASAYIAEVIRGGLAALPKGQYEAADSLGLDYWQSMRLIILPQALKISIPGIVNTFIGLFKDTTLVVFIGLLDPWACPNPIRATTDWNGIYWELFIFIALLFFVFCFRHVPILAMAGAQAADRSPLRRLMTWLTQPTAREEPRSTARR